MGMVMIVEGLPYFAAPGKMKSIVAQLLEKEDRFLRRFGLCLMLGGLLVVYLAMGGS